MEGRQKTITGAGNTLKNLQETAGTSKMIQMATKKQQGDRRNGQLLGNEQVPVEKARHQFIH
jgi:hypothetical protein